jgi:hypothetical protein
LFPLVSIPAERERERNASRLKCDKLLLDMIYNISALCDWVLIDIHMLYKFTLFSLRWYFVCFLEFKITVCTLFHLNYCIWEIILCSVEPSTVFVYIFVANIGLCFNFITLIPIQNLAKRVWWLVFVTPIQEVPYLNLSPEPGYSDWGFFRFPSAPLCKGRDRTLNSERKNSLHISPIHHSQIILPFVGT